MAADLNETTLKAVDFGGLVREDVMDKVWDISRIPLPFTDLVGSKSHSNSYFEWTTDRLAAPDLANAVIDGSDAAGDDTALGIRVGNQSQISDKRISVSTRSRNVDVIGRSDERAWQIMRRLQELKRDVEAISLTGQASVADDGSATAGNTAGIQAWMATNTLNGTTDGFAAGTVAAHEPGLKTAATEDALRNMIEQIWIGGGDPRVLMSTPAVIKGLNQYLFGAAARIATLEGKTSADAGTGQLTAKGSVNVFISDHGQVMEMRPNRLQPVYKDSGASDDVAALFILDPDYWAQSFLHGYRVYPLAKVGLSDQSQMAVDWGICAMNEESSGQINDIDFAAAWTDS